MELLRKYTQSIMAFEVRAVLKRNKSFQYF